MVNLFLLFMPLNLISKNTIERKYHNLKIISNDLVDIIYNRDCIYDFIFGGSL
jgi:hypothetical protein